MATDGPGDHDDPLTGGTVAGSTVAGSTAPGSTVPDTLDRLRRDVARSLGRPADAIGDHDDLLDLGLDSIRLMSLLQSWSYPGQELDLADFVDDPRLASWAPRVATAGVRR